MRYDATKEFKKFETKEGTGSNTSGHPRPRKGKTAKDKKKAGK